MPTEKNKVFSYLNDDDFIPVFAKDSDDKDYVYIPKQIDEIFKNKYLCKKDKYVLWNQVVVKVTPLKSGVRYGNRSEEKKDDYVLYEVIG